MSTIQITTKNPAGSAPLYATQTSAGAVTSVSIPITPGRYLQAVEVLSSPLAKRPEWKDQEYRQAYLEASIEQGIAWQIKLNRQRRGLSQGKLGDAIRSSQSGISRLEDPEYGGHSLETLVKLAHAFDCALSVRFIGYSQLAHESEDLSERALYAKPYSEDED